MNNKSKPLEILLVEELRQIFHSEMRKVDVLWDMAEAAKAPELSKTFTKLWDESLDNINDLEEIFTMLGVSTHKEIIEQTSHPTRQCASMPTKKSGFSDAELLDQADRMWIHEIAGYLTARTYAALLGYVRVTDMLQKILEEEQETEMLLTKLTKRLVHGNAELHPPPLDFPGFGFKQQLQTRLKDASRSSQFGKDGS